MASKFCPICNAVVTPAQEADYRQGMMLCRCGWIGHGSQALKEPALPNPPPKMSYVSVDIETTGLDPETCQVLEVGAVFEDWKSPISQLPAFRQILKYTELRGNPFALALNAELLKQIANPQPEEAFCQPCELGQRLANWVRACGLDPMNLTAAGKNFASFDMQFLKRLPQFGESVKFKHRVIDPAMLYWQFDDEKLPDSKMCYQRAGLDDRVAHTAVEDSRAVVRLIRARIHLLKGVS
jgi:DNA polymerase III alpha subunit (gram-positive type)